MGNLRKYADFEKIKAMREPLSRWNKVQLGSINDRIGKLETKIAKIDVEVEEASLDEIKIARKRLW